MRRKVAALVPDGCCFHSDTPTPSLLPAQLPDGASETSQEVTSLPSSCHGSTGHSPGRKLGFSQQPPALG